MSVTTYTHGGMQRRVFRKLLLLWAMFLVTAITVLLLTVPFAKAHAMEPLPLPKVTRETVEPEFTSFTTVPSRGVKADGCQALLKGGRSNTALLSPTRRTAGAHSSSPDMVKINAIKAYRHCKSQSALEQLAVWRWSR